MKLILGTVGSPNTKYEDLSKIDEPLQTFNLTQNGQYQFMTTYDKVSIFNLFSSF